MAAVVAVVGCILWYAAPYLSDAATEIVRLSATIKAAALQFENLPKDVSNIVVQSDKGLMLADVQILCRDSVVATIAQLTQHRSAVVKSDLPALLNDLHAQYGVCGLSLVPSTVFASHTEDTWIDRVLKAMGTLGVRLPIPPTVYLLAFHATLLQAAMEADARGGAVRNDNACS